MLIGEKVCLGPVLVGDAPVLFSWSNSLDLVRTNGLFRPTDEMQFNQWLSNLSKDPTRVVFTIRRQGNLQLLGWLQLFDIAQVSRSAEIGILVGDPAERGHGFGQEAMSLACGLSPITDSETRCRFRSRQQ